MSLAHPMGEGGRRPGEGNTHHLTPALSPISWRRGGNIVATNKSFFPRQQNNFLNPSSIFRGQKGNFHDEQNLFSHRKNKFHHRKGKFRDQPNKFRHGKKKFAHRQNKFRDQPNLFRHGKGKSHDRPNKFRDGIYFFRAKNALKCLKLSNFQRPCPKIEQNDGDG
jgi:hypothetical protein